MTQTEIKNKIARAEQERAQAEGSKCEVYSRIVGYHRPVENWNTGKKEEFKNRFTYSSDDN